MQLLIFFSSFDIQIRMCSGLNSWLLNTQSMFLWNKVCKIVFSFFLIPTCWTSCFSILLHSCCRPMTVVSLSLTSIILDCSCFSITWQFWHLLCKKNRRKRPTILKDNKQGRTAKCHWQQISHNMTVCMQTCNEGFTAWSLDLR